MDRSPIDLSPDGQWVAYTLSSQARKEAITDSRYLLYTRTGVPFISVGGAVWVTNITSGESKKLVKGSSSWGPSWSPDSRYLAFYSDEEGEAGLWIWERANGSVRRVSKEIVRPFLWYEVPKWMPDSKRILIKVLPGGSTIEDAANLLVATPDQATNIQVTTPSTVSVYSSSPNSTGKMKQPQEGSPSPDLLRNRSLSDLALLDVTTGQVQQIARRYTPTSFYVSPNGAYVAFTNIKGLAPNSEQTLQDIVLVSITDSQARVVVSDAKMSSGCAVSWSPDSKYLTYVESGPQAKGDVYIVPIINSGASRNLTAAVPPNFGTNSYSQPLWDATGRKIYRLGDNEVWAIPVFSGKPTPVTGGFAREILEIVAPYGIGRIWSPDSGQSAYVSTRDNSTKQVGFYKIDLTTGKLSKLIEESKTYGVPLNFRIDISDSGQQVVYVAEDAQHCADVWIADVDFSSPRRITRTNSRLDKYVMGASKLIEWRSEDGEKLQGALLLPAGYQEGKRYPLIVSVYEGYWSRVVNRFGLDDEGVSNEQMFATRGYAVLTPDMPLRVGTPMRDIAKTVMPGVDKVVEMGIADPDRLGVTGKSYGGYCVLSLIVQTPRFKAAVSRSGFGNLFSFYGGMLSDGSAPRTTHPEVGQGRIGGTPWQFRDRYIENSPIFYLDRVTTPLMLVAGAADTAAPAYLTEEVFVALRRLGKEVVYAKYKGGTHTEASFNYADSLDYFNRLIGWFDEKLKHSSKTPTFRHDEQLNKGLRQ